MLLLAGVTYRHSQRRPRYAWGIVSTRRQRPSWRSRVSCALLAASTLVVSLPASAAPTKTDPRKEREAIRKRRAEIAAQVDVTRAEDAKVEMEAKKAAGYFAPEGTPTESELKTTVGRGLRDF